MNFLQAVILGIIEGITEFLPISSTGHLILASTVLGLQDSEFLKTFEIAIQLGAILSVVVLYARSLIRDRDTMQKVFVAFLPTAVIGLLAYKAVKQYLLGNELVVIAALFLGGIFLVVFELSQPRDRVTISHVTYTQALMIGVFQSISIIPGVSRAAATIIGGLALGIDRKSIVEFSFLLAIPTMAAATGLDVIKGGASFTARETYLLGTGFVVSFIVALVCIKWLLRYVQNNTFTPFGLYRIAVAVVFWFFLGRQ